MIKLVKSSFYHEVETKKALSDFIINQDVLSMNTECHKFEGAFATKQKRKYAVFVTSGSFANFLLIQSMLNIGRFKKGDKIGFSALTWPTTVMPLIQLGLKPIAIDCSIKTLNTSPKILEKHIAGLKGVFLTNVLGFSDDLTAIKELCEKHNVILIEDNCQALGSKHGSTLLGNFGLASTFSFFVGHHMSTIEGGMICTDDEELFNYLVIGRAHGWDRNLSTQTQQKLREKDRITDFYAKYTFYDLASNFRPTEINGFIGNIQIRYWDEIVARRVDNFKHFQKAMSQNDDFYQYDLSHMHTISNFAMPIVCISTDLAENYRSKFESAEVEIRPIIAGNIVKQPFYKKYVKESSTYPNSDIVHTNGFFFGNNPEMTDEEINSLCELLQN